MDEKYVTVILGQGDLHTILRSKLDEAIKYSEWMVQTSVEGGLSRERAEELYGLKIVDNDDKRQHKINAANALFGLIHEPIDLGEEKEGKY